MTDSFKIRLGQEQLAEAINNACKVLPSDSVITVHLSQGAAEVILTIDGNESEFPSNRESLSETINDAVEYAQSTLGG